MIADSQQSKNMSLKSEKKEKIAAEKDLIQFKNVNIGYKNKIVLNNIDLIINKGDYIGIIGPNGSGKTSFFKTFLNLLHPLSGKITINGEILNKEVRNHIGYIPQSSTIPREFPLSVRDAVMMGRYGQIGMFKRPSDEDREAVHHALVQVHMHSYANRPIGHLSGGEQQKVLIARALVGKPDILLLDEPTSALDIQMTQSIFKLVDELNEKYQLTVLIVHHDVGLIRKHCHRLIIFDEKIRYDGDPNDPLADKAIEIAYNLK